MEIRLCYQVLELSPGMSRADLRQAYKDLVQVWHPDRFSHNPRLRARAEEKLVQINDAYETLGRLLDQRDRLQACFEEAEAVAVATPPPHATATKPEETHPDSAAHSAPHSPSQPFPRQSHPPRSRAYRAGPGLTVRWFFSALMLSLGVVVLLFAPFLIAYVVAQQPGWFLLPAVAMVGVCGYQILRIR